MKLSNSTQNRLLWLLAGLIMGVEFLIFDVMTSRHHASIYPQWSDQIQYLTEVYMGYDVWREHGWWAALWHGYVNPAAQGTLHDLLSVPLFAAVGPSRSAALSLNMLAFLLWQAALLYGVTRLSGSRVVGLIAFGLLPALAGPWSAGPGSAIDFRLDHAAMCLMGVTAVTALLTDGFRSRRGALLFGAAVGFTILERFLTGAYFAPIFLAMFLWIAGGADRRTRWINLALAAAVAFVLVAPQFWINRTWILNYYWVGHITGTESDARAPGLGFWASAQFIWSKLQERDLGSCLLWAALGITEILGLGALIGNRRHFRWPSRDWLFTALVFLTVPAAVLCLHRQKSEFVLGVIVPGFFLTVFWGWTALARRCHFDPAAKRIHPAGPVAAAFALLIGGAFFSYRQLPAPHESDLLTANAQLKSFAERIYQASLNPETTEPYIGFDRVSDAYDGLVLRVISYERHRTWVPIRVMLPISILPVSEEDLMDRLPSCDFFVLTNEMPGHGHWPYDQQMVKLQPFLRNWCDQHLAKVDEIQFLNRRMSLYQRPEFARE